MKSLFDSVRDTARNLSEWLGASEDTRLRGRHRYIAVLPSASSSAASSTATVLTSAQDLAGLTPLVPCHSHSHPKNRTFTPSQYPHNLLPKATLQKHRLYNKSLTAEEKRKKELNMLIENANFSHSEYENKKLEIDEVRESSSEENIAILENGVVDTDSDNEQILNKEKITLSALLPQVLAAVSVSIGSMVLGYASGYTSPALVSMQDQNSTITITDQEGSWIGSMLPLSAIAGAICGGPLIELVGRRNTIIGTAIPFFISWLLIGFAVYVSMIYVGRFIAGFCIGIASLCFPVYLGETVQPEVRGTLGLLPTALGNIGILMCFVAGMYLDWSKLAFLGSTIPVPFLISMFLIPETPRWYISKDRPDDARKALQWLRGKNANIENELNAIRRSHIEAEKNAGKMWDLLTKANVKPLVISMFLMLFQQLSGINAVIFYTVKIFRDAGSTIDGNICTIIVGVVNFGATFVATLLIDRLGRKALLYISGSSMIVSLGVLGTFFFLQSTDYNLEYYGWVPLLSFVVYVVGFSLGFGPIPWLMMGEILPAKIRGSAAALTTAFNWSFTFLVTKTYADSVSVLGTYGTFWMYGIVMFVSMFFIFFFVPETQGRSLEEIEKNMSGSPPVRRMSSIANLRPLPMAV